LGKSSNVKEMQGNTQQPYGSPPESNMWREDLHSTPKVSLIDAYEVS
jgi:hypothetical protein